jgi:uncharacterized damage-inducible protein DinB
MKVRIIPVLALAIATPAAAQQHMEHEGDHVVAAIRSVYSGVKTNLTRSAQQVPEADYGFKPTPDVRSFGQLIAHVANANYSYCAGALDEQNPNKVNIEETVTSKTGLVKALQESFAFCDRAYAIDDMAAMAMNGQRMRAWFLVQNAAHDNEHYGNIVTYLRLKGMVPPSSAGR